MWGTTMTVKDVKRVFGDLNLLSGWSFKKI